MTKHHEDNWADSGIPPLLRAASISDIGIHEKATPAQERSVIKARKQCSAWAARFAAGTNMGKGLLIHGPAGIGKTSLACATAHDAFFAAPLKSVGFRVHVVGGNVAWLPVQFLEAGAFIEMTKNGWDGDPVPGTKRRLLSIYGDTFREEDVCHLLILDNVGNEHAGATGYGTHVLHDLLRRRYYHGLTTIMTSNVAPTEDGWLTHFTGANGAPDEPFFDFLHEAVDFVPYAGPTWRR